MITLANMATFDEYALICDFAETYGIFDLYELPAPLAATLAVGLRDNSRIKTKMNNMIMPLDDYLLAAIYDDVQMLCWMNTKDAVHGHNKPERVLKTMTENASKKQENNFVVFDSPEDFQRARERLLRGHKNA